MILANSILDLAQTCKNEAVDWSTTLYGARCQEMILAKSLGLDSVGFLKKNFITGNKQIFLVRAQRFGCTHNCRLCVHL